MSVALAPVPRQLFLNPSNGAPYSGAKIFTYAAGTTTKLASFTDATGATPNTNPIILDTLGECDLWLTGGLSYKIVFSPPTDSDPPSNPIWTRDNIQAPGGAGGGGPIKTVTGDYSVTAADGTILVDASSGPITITLLDPSAANGLIFNIKKIDSTANQVTLAGTVDGIANPVIAFVNQNSEIQSNGTSYFNL